MEPRHTIGRLARSWELRLAILSLLALCMTAGLSAPAGANPPSEHYFDLSLEELIDVDVATLSRKPEPFFSAAAALYILTPEEIRRAGATSIPEALRLVPGLNVARANSSTWAISSRGFNDEFANKLLVLIDGRAVYTPLFSGVHWDVQDVMLEDLDRIEVIRGPGSSLWGPNAVNGVINIITKAASETQGPLVSVGGGSEDRVLASARYGGRLGENFHYRAYLKRSDHDGLVDASGRDIPADWDKIQGGFRVDGTFGEHDRLTVQGDLYESDVDERVRTLENITDFTPGEFDSSSDVEGQNILARWSRALSADSELTAKAYYDRTARDRLIYKTETDTADLDVQHRFQFGQRQDVVWGLGYRFVRDDTLGRASVTLSPKIRESHTYTGFVHDEITLIPERLRLSVGARIEHNDFTGWEIQPSVRTAWTPSERQTVWAAVSRAVRVPLRSENDVRIDIFAIPTQNGIDLFRIVGNEDVESEELYAYEAGYRTRPTPSTLLDIAVFYNDYRDLVTGAFDPSQAFFEDEPSPPHRVVPQVLANDSDGDTLGFEALGHWSVSPRWNLTAAYTWLHMNVERDFPDARPLFDEGESPEHQASIRSMLRPLPRVEFDTILYYVDNLSALAVDSYFRLDVRLGWHVTESFELSVVGQDLLDSHHGEYFVGESLVTTEPQRRVFAKVTWAP